MGGRIGAKALNRQKPDRHRLEPRPFSLDDSPPGAVDSGSQLQMVKALRDLGVGTHPLFIRLLSDPGRVAILQEREALQHERQWRDQDRGMFEARQTELATFVASARRLGFRIPVDFVVAETEKQMALIRPISDGRDVSSLTKRRRLQAAGTSLV